MDAGIELKGAVSPLTVLRLHTDDLGIIESELFQRVERAPQLLLNAPIVVDFAAAGANIDLERLVAALRRCQVVPVAAANLPIELCARAARAGLGTIPLTMKRRPTEPAPAPAPEPVAVATPEPVPAPAPEATVVHAVVRGGQVIYAQRTDLVVMAAVNACAQVIADGHIHIYGALRGRALAGAAGNTDARIFTQHFAPELVAIAGEYLMAEDIPDAMLGRPAQVYLQDGRCTVAPL